MCVFFSVRVWLRAVSVESYLYRIAAVLLYYPFGPSVRWYSARVTSASSFLFIAGCAPCLLKVVSISESYFDDQMIILRRYLTHIPVLSNATVEAM